jgi:hypothetical protein
MTLGRATRPGPRRQDTPVTASLDAVPPAAQDRKAADRATPIAPRLGQARLRRP